MPSLRQPNFAALVVAAWLAVAVALLMQYWPQTGERLLDTDDAMRLVELRAWLGGQGWFDLHEARLNPPGGYDTHWSRLIDAGLAGLLALFQWFADPPGAERLMRAVWPLLWLLPTMGGTAAIAWRLAGREAALVALVLALVGVPAYQQFTPGRIDHHNVQIALAVLIVAATAWSDRKPWTAIAAGLLSGLALAIGFESLPYVGGCGLALAARYVFDREAAGALRGYGLALAVATLAAFLVSTSPEHYARSQCDAIAINSAAAAMCGGLLLALSTRLPSSQTLHRTLAVAGAGAAALGVFLLFEPRCIGGPFALVDPAIWPIWHAHVRELQPLASVMHTNPLTAAGLAAFPAVALAAALALGCDHGFRRDFGFVAGALALALAAATTVVAIRGYSYAIWLGMPLVAAAAHRLFAMLRLRTLAGRLAATLFLTPMALSSGAITVAYAIGLDDTDSFARPASRHCLATAAYTALARLPVGLIATDISYGPFLLALTPHSVLAAPYHRLSTGLRTAHRALASPPDEARSILAGAKVDYVMICGPRPPDGLAEPAQARSLWGHLRGGAIPSWLEPLSGTEPFAVYRIRR